MRLSQLQTINKLYFGYEDLARALDVSPGSARVSASRYVNQGLLIRLKRNLYMRYDKWQNLSTEEIFVIANILQVPSYISLMTALEYYSITTQVQQGFVECVAVKRTKDVNIKSRVFKYGKINQNLYFGFVRTNNYFIATPEKAFVDALYLISLKRYHLDFGSLDLNKFNINSLRAILKRFPSQTTKVWKNL